MPVFEPQEYVIAGTPYNRGPPIWRYRKALRSEDGGPATTGHHGHTAPSPSSLPRRSIGICREVDEMMMAAPGQLIGLTGVSGAKKSDVSKHLVKTHGFKRVHAGMPVKKMVRAGFNMTRKQTGGDMRDKATARLGGAVSRDLMEHVGAAVHRAAPRATSVVLQRRVSPLLAAGHSVVVDGVRSPVEAATIRRMGGEVVRVDNGKAPDPEKPMDQMQAKIDTKWKIDSQIRGSGTEKDRKKETRGRIQAAADRMLDMLSQEAR